LGRLPGGGQIWLDRDTRVRNDLVTTAKVVHYAQITHFALQSRRGHGGIA
jgi:hypothetical protein